MAASVFNGTYRMSRTFFIVLIGPVVLWLKRTSMAASVISAGTDTVPLQ
jgi:hypothetical protein